MRIKGESAADCVCILHAGIDVVLERNFAWFRCDLLRFVYDESKQPNLNMAIEGHPFLCRLLWKGL
jgi:hypothetical protein